jgi:hypothetical protein
MLTCTAEIPKNITYHTPPRESSEPPQPTENIRQSSFKPNECAPSSSSLSWNEVDSAFHINKRSGRLPTVLEVPEHGLSEDGISSLGTAKTLYSSNMDHNVDPGALFPDMLDAADHPLAQDSSAQTPQLERVTCRTMERYNPSPNASTPSSFDSLSVDKSLVKLRESLDNLSVDFPETVEFDVPIPSPTEKIPQVAQMGIIHEEVPEKVNHPLIADTSSRSGSDHRAISSTRSEDTNSENGSSSSSSSSSEYDLKIFQISASSGTAIPTSAAAALRKGLELRAQSVSTIAILQILVDESNVPCLEFCQNLSKVCHLFGRESLFEEVLMAVDLIHAGCSIDLGPSSKEATRCLALKAQVLKKTKKYIDSEITYRQAISGLKNLGDTKGLLKCQLGLGSLLESIDRTREALYFLLEALMKHFTLPKTSRERRRVIELLRSIGSLHCKMELGENLTEMNESLLRLEVIQSRPVPQQKERAHFGLYVELVRLGGQYSKLGMSNLVELCFRYPPPGVAGAMSPQTRIRLCLFYNERCLYAKQEGKIDQSISHLSAALVTISPLMSEISVGRSGEYRNQLDLVAAFERTLSDIKPPPTSLVDNSTNFHYLALWKKAQAACRALRTDAGRAQEILASNDNIEHAMTHRGKSPSTSSCGSSMLSSGSSGYGVTYSVGSASSIVSNSAFMVP